VVCDVGGAYERRDWQLERLLRNSGWSETPEYDGSARIPWLAESLLERRDRAGDIERFACRICDPLEYDEGKETAEVFRAIVNGILAAEGLMITHTAGRTVLASLNSSGRATYSAPPDIDRRLRELVKDGATAELLVERIRETAICAENGAYTFAIIGIGSFVEGLLQVVLSERVNEVIDHGFLDENGRVIQEKRIGLHHLIGIAQRLSWIQLDAADFMNKVREYRNYVHPRVQLRSSQKFDRDSVMLCWAPVQAILNDLEEHLALITTEAGAY
jgi:hypothetical protein